MSDYCVVSCPFCGTMPDKTPAKWADNKYHQECTECGARGPGAKTQSEAKELWNDGEFTYD